MELKELLFRLCAEPGGPGNENEAARLAAAELSQYGETETDALGSVVCHMGRRGAARHILLDAHLDQIGLVVTGITKGGFLRVAKCGGVDRRTLPGAPVTVFGRRVLHGVICSTPPHLGEDGEEKALPIDKLAIDVGLPRGEAEKAVAPGDRASISFVQKSLLNGRVAAAGLDNRAGCAALIHCASLLRGWSGGAELTILLSTREEVGGQGARAAAFAAHPTQAIVVDVSFARQPGVPEEKSAPLGGGAMIGCAPLLDNAMRERLMRLGREHQIPFTHEIMGGATGTNAEEIAVAHAGVRTAMLSIPLRNMHTPVEVIDLRDVESVARLLAEYVKKPAD